MIPNLHGDMGFNEAIVSMMAVCVVLGLYLLFVASSAVASYDPIEGFDPDALEIEIVDNISVSESYMFTCLGTMDIIGMTVNISVPHFDRMSSFSVGSESNLEYSQSYLRVVDYDNGRNVPVFIEVIAYG